MRIDKHPFFVKNKFFILWVLVTLFFTACSNKKEVEISPIEVDEHTVSSIDGMALLDYPGPKAQIIYSKGNPDFFCDTVEFMAIYLNPEEKREIKAMFVQDMGKANWDNPIGNWIDAKKAFFVVGSKKLGSMGKTFATFKNKADAESFIKKEGGKLYLFDEINKDMTILDGGVMKDRTM